MIVQKTYRLPAMAASLLAGLSLVMVADAQETATGTKKAADVSEGEPPRIIATSPRLADTEVDPAITEITVTFDRDMSGGMSWTGGGPEFPTGREGQRARWTDKRTCALPVKLEAGHYYRAGINSTSYQNFRSTNGQPAAHSAIYFSTQGASEALKLKVVKPVVVSLTPTNNAADVDPNLKELRVTFSVPMGSGCSWCGSGDEYPKTSAGKKFRWEDDQKTCVLPVDLKPGHQYKLRLNSTFAINFQSASGVPLDPVDYSFRTKE